MARKGLAVVCVVMVSLGLVAGVVQAEDNRWSMDADGVITDSQTGLQWHVGPNYVGWDEARSYCRDLSVAGGGWRMPTMDELRGVWTGYDNFDSHYSMPPACNAKELNIWWVWSSERCDFSTAWGLNFYMGKKEWSSRTYAAAYCRVFAVRSQGYWR